MCLRLTEAVRHLTPLITPAVASTYSLRAANPVLSLLASLQQPSQQRSISATTTKLAPSNPSSGSLATATSCSGSQLMAPHNHLGSGATDNSSVGQRHTRRDASKQRRSVSPPTPSATSEPASLQHAEGGVVAAAHLLHGPHARRLLGRTPHVNPTKRHGGAGSSSAQASVQGFHARQPSLFAAMAAAGAAPASAAVATAALASAASRRSNKKSAKRRAAEALLAARFCSALTQPPQQCAAADCSVLVVPAAKRWCSAGAPSAAALTAGALITGKPAAGTSASTPAAAAAADAHTAHTSAAVGAADPTGWQSFVGRIRAAGPPPGVTPSAQPAASAGARAAAAAAHIPAPSVAVPACPPSCSHPTTPGWCHMPVSVPHIDWNAVLSAKNRILSSETLTAGHRRLQLPQGLTVHVVEAAAAVPVALEALRESMADRVVAIDLEWRPEFSAGSFTPVALMQLSSGSTAVLLRVCRMHYTMPQALRDFLSDPSITLLGFGWWACDETKMQRTFGLGAGSFGSFIDLQEVGGGLGYHNLGLARLARAVLGLHLPKSRSVVMSNWQAARLTDSQVVYGALDVLVAGQVFRGLRAWHRSPSPCAGCRQDLGDVPGAGGSGGGVVAAATVMVCAGCAREFKDVWGYVSHCAGSGHTVLYAECGACARTYALGGGSSGGGSASGVEAQRA